MVGIAHDIGIFCTFVFPRFFRRMSDVIQLLPDSVANQIAAGEVIQRPASVIKELVENSIDAGATQIKIILRDAGKTLIQVVDNGCGMSDTDARLSFERHATSKIRQAADLFELHTMGFRGEALPSIAAVAQIDLTTMRRDSQIGTHLQIAASRFESQEPTACTPGTNLSVKNLFFNFPARRKFLKKDSIELGHITREFERLALVNPGVEFELYHNDVNLYQLLPGSLRQRIAGLFGKSIDKQLIPVETDTPLVKITGFISLPEYARKRNPLQFFFVNGRNMRHPYFHKAVMSCYEDLIASDHLPNYFLSFEVDPQTIDVNIHPTKSEIKFENEQPIWQILSAAIREAMGRFNAAPALDFDREDAPEIPVFDPTLGEKIELNVDSNYNPFAKQSYTGGSASSNDAGGRNVQSASSPSRLNSAKYSDWERLYEDFRGATSTGSTNGMPTPESFLSSPGGDVAAIEASSLNTLPEMEGVSTAASAGLLQLSNRYLITPGRDRLIIVDRHRAHVKVLFERFIKLTADTTGESQQLLFPDIVELTPRKKAILDSISDEISSLGFVWECPKAADEGVFFCEIRAIPAVLTNRNTAEVLQKIIDDAEAETSAETSSINARIALSLAQSAAIRADQPLNDAEAEHLLSELFALPDPVFSPDGNRIIFELSTSEIAKRF